LQTIDSIKDSKDRWEELFFGVFAGNIFDYGASAVQEIIQSSKDENKEFGMKQALQKVQKRPWLHDNFDAFISRIEKVCLIDFY
jgi:type II pantothenate kinase